MRSSFLFFCAMSMAGPAAFAGPSLTLEQAIQRARQNHPAFRVSDAEIEAAEGNKAAASALGNPILSVGPGLKHTAGAGSENGFHGELGLEQTIEFPGKRSLRVLLADGDIRLRKLAREGFAQELGIRMRREFFQALAAAQVSELRIEQVQSAQTFLQAARKRVEGGYASDFETVKAQADLIAARKALGESAGAVRRSKLRLSALMGMPDTSFTLAGKLDSSSFAAPQGDVLAMAMAGNPAVKARALQVELSEKNIRAAELVSKPDFSLAPSLEYTKDEQIYGLNVSLPLPIWNRGKGEVRKASAEHRVAQAELEKVKQEVALSVQEAQEKVSLAEAQLALYTPEFLDGLKSIMHRAEKVYGQSSTTLLIYLESRRSYYESLSDYYQALGSWTESHIDLEAAAGISLGADTDKNGVK